MQKFDASLHISGHSVREKVSSLLHDVLGIDQSVIECLSFRDNGSIFDNVLKEEVGDYIFVDDGLPVVGFRHKAYMQFAEQGRLGFVPLFVPMAYNRHCVGLQWHGANATPDLHAFLMGDLLTQWVDRPGYTIRKYSNPFFQGGSHDPEGGWFYIEFLGRRDIYKTVAWINETFRYSV